MRSKRPILYVCLLIITALALAMAGQLAGQSSSIATAVLLDHDGQTRPSNAQVPFNKLSQLEVHANPCARGIGGDPSRRPLCAL
jgi:hypothetical protein